MRCRRIYTVYAYKDKHTHDTHDMVRTRRDPLSLPLYNVDKPKIDRFSLAPN